MGLSRKGSFAMKSGLSLVLSVFCFCSVAVSAPSPGGASESGVREFTVREGLPNFRKKVESGSAAVAYFGGSITEQNGWRILSYEFLRDHYWDATFRRVDAAIGGTGSLLGVFRMDRDVLAGKPDLIFVEFAVNDRNRPSMEIRRSMEGIVRKTRRVLPETDLCFVYTIVEQDLNDLQQGKASRAVRVMEEVADHYGIPSVHMGVRVAELAKQGKLLFRAGRENVKIVSGSELNLSSDLPVTADGKIPFSADGVHPYENTGHLLYADALKRALPAMLKAGRPGKRPLPPPLCADNDEHTAALTWKNPAVKCRGRVENVDPEGPVGRVFLARMPELRKFSPGSEVEFRFQGRCALLYGLFGPGCGSLEISVDGGAPRTESFFDSYSTYYRIGAIGLADSLPDGVHTIRIRVTGTPLDKRARLADQTRFDASPEEYRALDGYFGAVFVEGRAVP